MTLEATNPVVSFRKPAKLSRSTGSTHFDTKREDVVNDMSMLNIYPSDFTYLKDQTLEVDFALWEAREEIQSHNSYMRMTGRDGYQIAMASEWKVDTRLQNAWKADVAGRLTFGGMSTNTMVLMWRTGERYDIAERQRLKVSDEIQKSAEEKKAELQERFNELGAKVSVNLVDDDEEDGSTSDLPTRIRGKRGRPRLQ